MDMVMAGLNGRSYTIDGREFVFDRIFNIGPREYTCQRHAPKGAYELSPQEISELIIDHVRCDHATEAHRHNLTSYPVRPIECVECEDLGKESSLWYENRRFSV